MYQGKISIAVKITEKNNNLKLYAKANGLISASVKIITQ
jgi:hypothetical protein